MDHASAIAAFGVFGISPAMQPVLRLIQQAASNGSAVLLSGEPGTGRGRVARSIHAVAGGAPEAFTAVDCAASAREDLEAALFGCDAGSCGRRTSVAGEPVSARSALWTARAGTLYLANVVEAPSWVQTRLVRVMRDREAIGPDGTRTRLDCRLVASVEPDYRNAVREGRFRRDLCGRLAGLVIGVPPLRERKEEIPALARFFLERDARASGSAPKHLSASAAMLLQALPWQENGRELRGLLESLAQWVPGDVIDLADVLARVRLDPNARSVAVGGTLRMARRRFEREYIEAVLRQCQGRIPAAATALGIERTNLYRKMRALGLVRQGGASGATYPGEPDAGSYQSNDRRAGKWPHK